MLPHSVNYCTESVPHTPGNLFDLLDCGFLVVPSYIFEDSALHYRTDSPVDNWVALI